MWLSLTSRPSRLILPLFLSGMVATYFIISHLGDQDVPSLSEQKTLREAPIVEAQLTERATSPGTTVARTGNSIGRKLSKQGAKLREKRAVERVQKVEKRDAAVYGGEPDQPVVRMKLIPVSELVEKLEKIKSSLDFVRLFTDPALTDQQIYTWLNLTAHPSESLGGNQPRPGNRSIRSAGDDPVVAGNKTVGDINVVDVPETSSRSPEAELLLLNNSDIRQSYGEEEKLTSEYLMEEGKIKPQIATEGHKITSESQIVTEGRTLEIPTEGGNNTQESQFVTERPSSVASSEGGKSTSKFQFVTERPSSVASSEGGKSTSKFQFVTERPSSVASSEGGKSTSKFQFVTERPTSVASSIVVESTSESPIEEGPRTLETQTEKDIGKSETPVAKEKHVSGTPTDNSNITSESPFGVPKSASEFQTGEEKSVFESEIGEGNFTLETPIEEEKSTPDSKNVEVNDTSESPTVSNQGSTPIMHIFFKKQNRSLKETKTLSKSNQTLATGSFTAENLTSPATTPSASRSSGEMLANSSDISSNTSSSGDVILNSLSQNESSPQGVPSKSSNASNTPDDTSLESLVQEVLNELAFISNASIVNSTTPQDNTSISDEVSSRTIDWRTTPEKITDEPRENRTAPEIPGDAWSIKTIPVNSPQLSLTELETVSSDIITKKVANATIKMDLPNHKNITNKRNVTTFIERLSTIAMENSSKTIRTSTTTVQPSTKLPLSREHSRFTRRPKTTRKPAKVPVDGSRIRMMIASMVKPNILKKTADDYNRERLHKGLDPEDPEALLAAFYDLDERVRHRDDLCRVPQKFVQKVYHPTHTSRMLYPDCVMLHRCLNSSGCCGPLQQCGPKRVEVIHKAFLVVTLSDMYNAHWEPDKAITMSFTNHTECACQLMDNVQSSIGCHKWCPAPFRQVMRGWSSCFCDCQPGREPGLQFCEEIKGGARILPEKDISCIKNGNCYAPTCDVGDFDISTGYCPLNDYWALPPSFFQENPEYRRHYRKHVQLPETPASPSTTPPLSSNASALKSSHGSMVSNQSAHHTGRSPHTGPDTTSQQVARPRDLSTDRPLGQTEAHSHKTSPTVGPAVSVQSPVKPRPHDIAETTESALSHNDLIEENGDEEDDDESYDDVPLPYHDERSMVEYYERLRLASENLDTFPDEQT